MIYMFLSNNPSSGDINSSNLSCFTGMEHGAQIIFCHFFHKLNLVILKAKMNGFKVFCVGNSSYSCIANSFETLQVFGSWSEDVHIIWI